MINYILEGKKVVECSDILKWGKWLGEADRRVAETEKDGIRVSTVFLGTDHSFGGGKLQLFETMIFGGERDQEMWRYPTWEEAEKGHVEAEILAGLR